MRFAYPGGRKLKSRGWGPLKCVARQNLSVTSIWNGIRCFISIDFVLLFILIPHQLATHLKRGVFHECVWSYKGFVIPLRNKKSYLSVCVRSYSKCNFPRFRDSCTKHSKPLIRSRFGIRMDHPELVVNFPKIHLKPKDW